MKIQIKKLQQIYPSLQKLFTCDSLPVTKRWKIKSLAKICTATLTEFMQVIEERRKSLGEPNEAGGFKVKKEHIEKFYEEITELEKQEIELPVGVITLVAVDIDKAKLTALDLGVLDELNEIIKIEVTEEKG